MRTVASDPPFDWGSAGTQLANVRPYQRPTSTIVGLRTAMRAMWSTDSVFSLSLNPYVGTPPNRRSVASMQAMTVGSVLSRIGSTTRKRLQASQAHHNHDLNPLTSR